MTAIDETLRALRQDGPDAERESAALGGWLLRRAGLGPRDGLVTVAPDPTLSRVPFARRADWIAWIADDRVVVVPRHAVEVREGANLAGEPRDTVTVRHGAEPQRGQPISPDELSLRGALVRAALMAHALECVAELVVAHAEQRVQFGRPIARFQAVQAHLVTVAQQAALAAVAYDAAAGSQRAFEIAAAKQLANRAAVIAGRAAHQVLGARGVTLEHPLPEHTKRLWSWRGEYGDERHWSQRLSVAVTAAGPDRLYATITAGGTELEL